MVRGNQLCLAVGVGAVLQQKMGDQWRPISFFSKKLTPTETRYNTFGRELLAAYLAVRYFLYIDRPQALAGRLPLKLGQVFTPWNKISGLSVIVHFRYPFCNRTWKCTCRRHLSWNKFYPAGFMCENQRFVDQLSSKLANLVYNSPTQSQRLTYVPKLL